MRIIAATHKDLKALTESGEFRSDLFYRLNVLCLELSPLQGRRKDIIDIGERLLAETCRRLNKPGLVLGEQASEAARILARKCTGTEQRDRARCYIGR